MRTDLKLWHVHAFFNCYVIKSVFFGCGIVNLSLNEEKELEKNYEMPTLKN